MLNEKPEPGSKKKTLKRFFSKIGSRARKTVKKFSTRKRPAGNRIGLIILFILLLLVFVSMAVFAAGIYIFKWNNRPTNVVKKIIPFPAAIVSFKTITINDVEEDASHIEHFYQKSGGEQANQPNAEVIKNQVLDRLIEDQVVANLARKYKIRLEDKEIEDQFQQIVKENGGEGKVKSLLEDLYGLTVPEFKKLIGSQLQKEKLRQKFEDSLRSKVKAKHILVKVGKKAKKKERVKAKKEAQRILAQVKKKGADFAKIAKKYSQDKATKNKGGSLPWFGKGDMTEPFEKAAFGLDVGEISGLVKTNFGYHIIQLEDKRGDIEENFNDWIDGIKKSWIVWKLINW